MKRLASVLPVFSALAPLSFGQAPDSLSFQGFLTDSTGNPIDAAGVGMTFTLYKGATPVWSESQSVDVDDGRFDVLLGATKDAVVEIRAGTNRADVNPYHIICLTDIIICGVCTGAGGFSGSSSWRSPSG